MIQEDHANGFLVTTDYPYTSSSCRQTAKKKAYNTKRRRRRQLERALLKKLGSMLACRQDKATVLELSVNTVQQFASQLAFQQDLAGKGYAQSNGNLVQ